MIVKPFEHGRHEGVGPEQLGGDVSQLGKEGPGHGRECGSTESYSAVVLRRERLDLAYEEYCQRVEGGEQFDIEEFCRKFTGLESDVRRQVVVHEVIGEAPAEFLECFEQVWPAIGEEIGGFRLMEELGRGSFSRVFLAADMNLGEREVVVKVSRNVLQEALVLGRLSHEGIVPVHAVQHDEEWQLSVICMPYLSRVTLRDVMDRAWEGQSRPVRASDLMPCQSAELASKGDRRHSIPRELRRGTYVEGALFVASRIAQAMAYAHQQKVLHLDLKPSNVLIDQCGCPRLLDFNLACDSSQAIPRIGGTLAYMSPEQARGFLDGQSTQLDERSDIFSLGVVLFEMLCDRLPFPVAYRNDSSREAVEELIARHTETGTLSWSAAEADGQARKIVNRCLAIDPNKRYQSMAELARDLQQTMSTLSRSQRWVRSHRHSVIAYLGLATIVVGAISMALASRLPYPQREYHKGVSCLAAGRHEEAIDHLSQAVVADPTHYDALIDRARAYVAAEAYHDAVRDLTAAGKLRSDGRQQALFGFCCNMLDSHAEAIGVYQSAIEQGFVTAALLNNLGYSYYVQGDVPKALVALNKCVALDGDLAVARFNRATVRYSVAVNEGRQPVDAMQDIDVAISSGLCTGDVFYLAATVYGHAGACDESWRSQARQFIDLALGNGVPFKSIASDAVLMQLLDIEGTERVSRDATVEAGSWRKSHLLNPVE